MATVALKDFVRPKKDKYYLDWGNLRNFMTSEVWRKISKLENSDIHFNLDGFDKVNLDGLIWLLLIGDILRKKKNYLVIHLPKDKKILRYMKSVGFDQNALELYELYPRFYFDEIEEYGLVKGVKIEKVKNSNLNDVKGKFQKFIDSEEFAKMIGEEPTGQIFWEYIRPLLKPTIFELLNNIVEHSGKALNTGHGYAGIFKSGSKISIFIADAGVGFKEGLERRGLSVQREEDAIKKAFLFKYYRSKEREGVGIFGVLKNLRKLGGWVKVGSGKSEGYLEKMEVRLREEQNEDDIIRRIVERNLILYQRSYFPGVQYGILIDIQNIKHDRKHHGWY